MLYKVQIFKFILAARLHKGIRDIAIESVLTVESNGSLAFLLSYLRRNCFPANIYLFNVNNRSTRKRYEICSKLNKKTP